MIKPRVALVTNVLSHYRVPCFARLAEILSGQMTFFLLAEKMEHRSYIIASEGHGLPIMGLRGWRWSNPLRDDLHLNDLRPVWGGDFDLIILGGWSEPAYLLLWFWAVLSQKKLIFWVESTAYERFRSWPKEKFKKFLLRSAAGCIVPGKRSREYCRKLGMSEERIFFTPNSVDRDYFRNQAEKLLPLKNTLREGANLKGFVILFVGRLVESIKGVSTLIKACGELERKGRKIALLLAGDGPDSGSYRELVRREGLRDVRFLGFLNYEVLCQYYAMAHVLVLPSYSEPWGLVLNEGMEFGLPLVVSEAVGAGPDLVNPGKNGFVIPAGNASALAQVLEKLVEDENLRSKMGEASRAIIEHFSPENWAEGVVRAIEAI